MLRFLTQEATIQRSATVMSATREVTRQWTTLEEGVPCMVRAKSGSHRYDEQGFTRIANYVGYFEPTTSIQVGDRISLDGGTLEVEFVVRHARHVEVQLALIS